jgi:hypothetical protein
MNIALLFLEAAKHVGQHFVVHKFWDFVEESQHKHIMHIHNADNTSKKTFYDYYFPGQNFILVSNPDYDDQRKDMLEIIALIEKEKTVPRYTFFHHREIVLWLCEKYDCFNLIENYLKEEIDDVVPDSLSKK